MLNPYHKMWGVIEQPRFESELRLLIADPVRADEFVDGAKNTLARNPELGTKIGEKIWFLPMGIGKLAIYYQFDSENIYLESIHSREDED